MCSWQLVRVHHPLQQGLRLRNPFIFADYSASASTSSITTRIKTASGTCYTSVTLRVRVHHPLQQGLRLTFGFIILIISYVRVHHPLQQGLRPHLCVY